MNGFHAGDRVNASLPRPNDAVVSCCILSRPMIGGILLNVGWSALSSSWTHDNDAVAEGAEKELGKDEGGD
jgi:hypothetical protein